VIHPHTKSLGISHLQNVKFSGLSRFLGVFVIRYVSYLENFLLNICPNWAKTQNTIYLKII